ADGFPAIELFGVIEDGKSIVIERGRAAPSVNIVDYRLRQAGLERHLLVDVPFELGVTMPSRDQDRQLLQLRRQRGAKAQQLTKLLPFVRELGSMQYRAQWPAQLAARARHHGIVDAALLRR